jgi:hypothetical protein
VADAVEFEPVSSVIFPASRENAGIFGELNRNQAKKRAVNGLMFRGIFAEFPTQPCREFEHSN